MVSGSLKIILYGLLFRTGEESCGDEDEEEGRERATERNAAESQATSGSVQVLILAKQLRDQFQSWILSFN